MTFSTGPRPNCTGGSAHSCRTWRSKCSQASSTPAPTPSRWSLARLGEDQQKLEQAVILGSDEAGEARVLDVVVGEQHRDLAGHLDLRAAALRHTALSGPRERDRTG